MALSLVLPGLVEAEVIFGGDFQLYKPGTNYTVTGELSGPGNFDTYTKGVGDGVEVVGSTGLVNFSDGTDSSSTGNTADLPGWTIINGGNPDLGLNGVDGSSGLNIFAAWGGTQRIETDAPVGIVEAGAVYTITAMVDGPSGGPIEGTLAFHLVANGTILTPSSKVDVALPGGSGFQVISRTYDSTSYAGHLGEELTIILGVEDDNTNGNRMIWDDVSLEVEGGFSAKLELGITPSTETPGSLDFEWDGQIGYTYDLVSSTDLSTSPDTWEVWDERSGIAGENAPILLTEVPGGGTKRFFALIRSDAP